jgi:virulence factor Mce-like protein
MVVFALSCLGLLLFLWLSFGGPIPLNPQGYRFRVAFPEANQLSVQADVRIAGVTVGKVVSKSIDPHTNRTVATIELQNQYAPIHQDARAILSQKTILGETYVMLSPGSPARKPLPDNALLPLGRVENAVQLSQIFDALDPRTRRALQIFQQQLAAAVADNASNLSNVLGNLPTFAADASDILAVLDLQHAAVVSLVQNGGAVFSAVGQNQSALRSLITTAESTFATTAANQAALSRTFQVLPTFLRESRTTMSRLQRFAGETDPVIRALNPAARQLRPTLRALDALSPDLRVLLTRLGRLITVARTGLPAYASVLKGATPLLGATGPLLEQLNPILSWLAIHQQLLSDFISNGGYGLAAKTTTFGGAGLTCAGVPCGHYLRQFGPTGPETFGLYQNRDANNRGNTYPPPLWLGNPEVGRRQTLEAWDCRNAGGEHPPTGNQQACWVAPRLPGATGPYRIPHIMAAHYPRR